MAGSSAVSDTYAHRVLLFASLRETAGESIEVALPRGSTVASLLEAIRTCQPALAPWLPYVRVAVNCEYASADRAVHLGDEIALLPPVSGGASGPGAVSSLGGHVRALVTAEELDIPRLIQSVVDASGGSAGAVVPFIGIVRDNARGESVTHLEYQAYGAMAEAEMARIGAEAALRWTCFCTCAHRTGVLQIGEASLLVIVATAHRGEAFEACRWIVDEIKKRVPIWKKEFASNGTFWIEDPFLAQPPVGQPPVGQPPVVEAEAGAPAGAGAEQTIA